MRAAASPPAPPTIPPTTSGNTNACQSTGWSDRTSNCGKVRVTGSAATTIGIANPSPTAEPASAAGRGRRSRPFPCSRPARNARTTTATVSAPIATWSTASVAAPAPPKMLRLRATWVVVNVTRTLASVSARPILNQDHGRYQWLTAYVSHAIAWPAMKTGRNTINAPRARPWSTSACGRVSGGSSCFCGQPALMSRAAPPRGARPARGSARRRRPPPPTPRLSRRRSRASR